MSLPAAALAEIPGGKDDLVTLTCWRDVEEGIAQFEMVIEIGDILAVQAGSPMRALPPLLAGTEVVFTNIQWAEIPLCVEVDSLPEPWRTQALGLRCHTHYRVPTTESVN